jgi:hypothetical protein
MLRPRGRVAWGEGGLSRRLQSIRRWTAVGGARILVRVDHGAVGHGVDDTRMQGVCRVSVVICRWPSDEPAQGRDLIKESVLVVRLDGTTRCSCLRAGGTPMNGGWLEGEGWTEGAGDGCAIHWSEGDSKWRGLGL